MFCLASISFGHTIVGGTGHGTKTSSSSSDSGYKPYKCDYCGFQSRSKAYMKDHEKQHIGTVSSQATTLCLLHVLYVPFRGKVDQPTLC